MFKALWKILVDSKRSGPVRRKVTRTDEIFKILARELTMISSASINTASCEERGALTLRENAIQEQDKILATMRRVVEN